MIVKIIIPGTVAQNHVVFEHTYTYLAGTKCKTWGLHIRHIIWGDWEHKSWLVWVHLRGNLRLILITFTIFFCTDLLRHIFKFERSADCKFNISNTNFHSFFWKMNSISGKKKLTGEPKLFREEFSQIWTVRWLWYLYLTSTMQLYFFIYRSIFDCMKW